MHARRVHKWREEGTNNERTQESFTQRERHEHDTKKGRNERGIAANFNTTCMSALHLAPHTCVIVDISSSCALSVFLVCVIVIVSSVLGAFAPSSFGPPRSGRFDESRGSRRLPDLPRLPHLPALPAPPRTSTHLRAPPRAPRRHRAG
jgi:hypothetical protein